MATLAEYIKSNFEIDATTPGSYRTPMVYPVNMAMETSLVIATLTPDSYDQDDNTGIRFYIYGKPLDKDGNLTLLTSIAHPALKWFKKSMMSAGYSVKSKRGTPFMVAKEYMSPNIERIDNLFKTTKPEDLAIDNADIDTNIVTISQNDKLPPDVRQNLNTIINVDPTLYALVLTTKEVFNSLQDSITRSSDIVREGVDVSREGVDVARRGVDIARDTNTQMQEIRSILGRNATREAKIKALLAKAPNPAIREAIARDIRRITGVDMADIYNAEDIADVRALNLLDDETMQPAFFNSNISMDHAYTYDDITGKKVPAPVITIGKRVPR
jgi:hypothetical protein